METLITEFVDMGLNLGKNIFNALLVLVIGLTLTKMVTNFAVKAMQKAKIEQTLVTFLKSVLNSGLKIIIFLSVLGTLGFPTTSLVAIFGTTGAALALGFKDSLGSFTSGVIILFSKPFKVGDYIVIDNHEGTVKEIQVMYTTLSTIDNKIIVVPNSQMTSNIIVNHSYSDNRRLDLRFDISYDQDVEIVKELIKQVISNHESAFKEPEPFVRVCEYKSSSVEILIRVWCKNEEYHSLKFDLLEQIRAEFIKHDIEIPYNQLDINIKQTN